jgi:hypothetical protein
MHKETILVGVCGSGSVICMPEDAAYEYARLQRALATAKTWGEFRALAPPDSLAEAEERALAMAEGLETADDDPTVPPADDASFDPYHQIHGIGDGDWPYDPASDMLDWLSEGLQELGERVTTRFNGDRLEIEAARLPLVIAALEAEGYRVIHSDAAIAGGY